MADRYLLDDVSHQAGRLSVSWLGNSGEIGLESAKWTKSGRARGNFENANSTSATTGSESENENENENDNNDS